MLDALVRSAIFGIRNVDKVQNGDTGRSAAMSFQLYNAGKEAVDMASKLDNAVGKGAQTAVKAMETVSNSSKALKCASKVVDFGSKNVNFLLCGAAGYRIYKAENKEKAVKKEIWGMSTMFTAEHLMREFLNCKKMMNFKAGIGNKYLRWGLSILEGVAFIVGSVTASNAGYKIGEKLYDYEQKTYKKLKLDKLKANLKDENYQSTLTDFLKNDLKINQDEHFLRKESLA